MNQNLIEIKNLSKEFKGQPVLKNITMAIPKNCVYGLLGPNGAGKSTLMKTMTGLLRPTSGEIYFQGHPWSRKDLAHIGALIETPPIYENLTARENLRVRALLLGVSEGRIEEVLRLTDIADTGKKKAGAFSLGMKQRLGIALALLGNPKLLILDEPINGLDPLGIQELRHLIRSFPKQGITVMISSHILSEIQQTADHIGIISGGRLGFEGEIDEKEDLEELFMEIAAKGRVER
ncbi:lantibiotic protection ABC transporter ATP-binding protein [Ruminococcus sp. 5_1_39BFAA]|uniref:lantibiotic protection ABC transporter ATP-binding protein n=1 Tax=Ruminococcus sp. 5_1_39BFAA TaxID=457412 RepID=UPI00356A3A8F